MDIEIFIIINTVWSPMEINIIFFKLRMLFLSIRQIYVEIPV